MTYINNLSNIIDKYCNRDVTCVLKIMQIMYERLFESNSDFITLSPVFVYIYYNLCTNVDMLHELVKAFEDEDDPVDTLSVLLSNVRLLRDVTYEEIDKCVNHVLDRIDELYCFINPICIAYVRLVRQHITVPALVVSRIVGIEYKTYSDIVNDVRNIASHIANVNHVDIVRIVPSKDTYDTFLDITKRLITRCDRYDPVYHI